MENSVKSVPRFISGFEVISKIGQGGMGAVLKARQVSLDRIVALKVLPPKIAQKDPVFIERFFREARVSAKLNHPNIVQGIEVGQDEPSGLYYFAMEFIDGLTLRQIMKKEGALDEKRALQIVAAIASALASANKAGIVHRDIKPDNILLTSRGEPKLADLGLAKRVGESEDASAGDDGAPASGPGVDASLTQAGSALGTPYYMAPEQVTGKGQIDTRTDLYALGATLFHLISGRAPFGGKTSAEIMQARLVAPPPDLRRAIPDAREDTARIITRLMQRDPAKRFQTPEALEQEIERVLKTWDSSSEDTPRDRARKRPAAAGNRAGLGSGSGDRPTPLKNEATRGSSAPLYAMAAGAIVLVGAVVFFLMHGDKPQPTQTANAETPKTQDVKESKDAKEIKDAKGASDDKGAKESKESKAALPEVAVKPKTDIVAPPAAPPAPEKEAAQKLATPDSAPTQPMPTKTAEAPPPPPAPVAAPEPKPEAKPAPQPPPALAAASQEALDALWFNYAAVLSSGADKNAANLLTDALGKPEFAGAAAEIKAEQQRQKWLGDLDKTVEAGAAKLTDNRAFTLVMKDGRKEAVGGSTPAKLTKLKNGVLEGERSEQGATMGLRWKLSDLSLDTRRELSLLSADPDKAAAMELRARWLYADILSASVKPAIARMAELDGRLTELRADGAPAEILDGLQAWHRRIQSRLDAALKASATRVAEEKRKADEKKAAANIYYNVHAGDWGIYKNTDRTPKLSVLKKDDHSVTLLTSFPHGIPPVERTIDLNAPYTYADEFGFTEYAKKTEEGEESLSVNGKNYACKRLFYYDRYYNNPANKKGYCEIEHQIWWSPDAPLNGVVRYRMKWIKSHDPNQIVNEGLFGVLCDLTDFGTGGK